MMKIPSADENQDKQTTLIAKMRAMVKAKTANVLRPRQTEGLAALVAERTARLEQELSERRQAETALSESHERYRIFFDSTTDLIFLKDDALRYLMVNHAYQAFLGRAENDILGKSDAELMPPELAAACRQSDLQALQADGLVASEERTNDRTFEAHKFPVRLGAGKTGVGAFIRDITGHAQTEERLRLNETRLSSLLSLAQYAARNIQDLLDFALDEAVKLTDSRIGYIYHYDEGARQFTLNTWSRDVMAECAVLEPQTVYELDKTGIWGEAVRQRSPIIVNDFLAPHALKKGYPEGHVVLTKFLTVPVFESNQIVAVVGVANKDIDYDQTDVLQLSLLMDSVWKAVQRQRAEDELRASQESLRQERKLLRTVIDNLPGPVYVKDRDLRKTLTNRADYLTMGFEREEQALGISDFDVFAPEIAQAFCTDDRTVIESGQPILDHEERLVTADGQSRWLLTSKFPLKDRQEHIIGLVGIGHDITKRKQAEEEQKRLEAQFIQSQKMEAIGKLAGGIAHDFNNLLVPILGYAELGLLKLSPDDDLYLHLTRIRSAAERAAGLTRQILAFSRQQVLDMEVFDLNQVIQEVDAMLQRLIGEDIERDTRLASDLAGVKGDKGQLGQLLLNLAVNARDAMSDGGRLTIETVNLMLTAEEAARHPDLQPGRYVRLTVADTGHGMDAATLERIFDPFFTTKALGQGTGLGLSTVFGIVKQHEGGISVRSQPGHGTTFDILLPTVAAVAALQERAPTAAGELYGAETIMVVEDEANVRYMVSDALNRYSYQILVAEDPQAAIALATGHSGIIHLLLTDVVLPQMKGPDLYRQLAPQRPDMRVLYMSGYTDTVISHFGILDNKQAFIQKPFAMRALLEKVRAILDSDV